MIQEKCEDVDLFFILGILHHKTAQMEDRIKLYQTTDDIATQSMEQKEK